MDHSLSKRIISVQTQLAQDPDYQKLQEELDILDPAMLHLMVILPREQAEVLEDYLGLIAEMHRRMLILACQWNEEQ